MLTSYAQNFEDVILWRALKHVENGFYIDIGAQDPVVDSVSLAFYEKGWRGVHVEPVPANAARLRAARPDEDVVEAAITREEGEIEIFEIPETGLSTGKEGIAKTHKASGFRTKSIKVAAMPLSKLFERRAGSDIHWLKIDVEGMEEEVIASWQPSLARPWVLCIESTLPRSQVADFAAWEPLVLELGYEFIYFDGLNRFYLHNSHAELRGAFDHAPNIFDDFALSGQASAPFAHNLKNEIEELRRNLLASNDGFQHQSAEVARLHHHIVETGKAYAEERNGLNERVAQLAQWGETKDAEIARLHHHIAATDRAYAEERNGLNERVAQLAQWGETKDAEIARLHHHIAATDRAYAEERNGLNERVAQLAQSGETKDTEIGRLHHHIAATDRAYAEERNDLNERVAQMAQSGDAKDAEIARLHHRIAEMDRAYTEERNGLNERVAQLAQSGETKDTEIGRLHHHIAATDRAYAEERNDLNERVAQMAQSGDAKDTEIGRLHDHISAIHNSTSWKITAPMRGFVGGTRAATRLPKTTARLVAHHGVLWLRRRPHATAFTRRIVRFAPPLERRLLAFARTIGDSGTVETGWMLEPDPAALREWRRLLRGRTAR